MFKQAFNHRSGRVVSLSRFVLAFVFLGAIWIDPSQPAHYGPITYPAIAAYTCASLAVLIAAWNSWRFDHLSSRLMHIVDIGIFLGMVYLTEGYTSSFTSPFFTFFLFLLFAATVRWGWRATVWTASVTTILYVAVGLMGGAIDIPDFDPYRFGRRTVYLVLMSMVMIWFGINQTRRTNLGALKALGEGDSPHPPTQVAIAQVAAMLHAKRVVFAWWPHDEPWVTVTEYRDGTVSELRHSPGDYLSIADCPTAPYIFDLRGGQPLALAGDTAEAAKATPSVPGRELLAILGIERGLSWSVISRDYRGQVIATGIDGLCSDDLSAAREIGDEISAAFDRHSTALMGKQAAAGKARIAIARDLHDSVAQVLTGASFRMDALQRRIDSGREVGSLVLDIQNALRTEQLNIREMIEGLRDGIIPQHPVDLVASVRTIGDVLARQWAIGCTVSAGPGELKTPQWFEREIGNLVREAVSNAVRHGKAKNLVIALAWDKSEIRLSASDDGCGFPKQGNDEQNTKAIRPWSIHERVKQLGGQLALYSDRTGSRIDIVLPRIEPR